MIAIHPSPVGKFPTEFDCFIYLSFFLVPVPLLVHLPKLLYRTEHGRLGTTVTHARDRLEPPSLEGQLAGI